MLFFTHCRLGLAASAWCSNRLQKDQNSSAKMVEWCNMGCYTPRLRTFERGFRLPPIDENDRLDADKSEQRLEQLGDIRRQAVALLARREHAHFELMRKLSAKGFEDALIETVLNELSSEQLLSEHRFANEFVRSRAAKGYGPNRIRSELQARRVDEVIIEAYLQSDWDWFEQAVRVNEKRFGDKAVSDVKIRAKQYRFLQYRGFSPEQISAALRQKD